MIPKLRNMTSVYLVDSQGILMLYRIGSRVANNKYVGSAGGHFEQDEMSDPKKCVLRELEEELGLDQQDVQDLTLRYITYRLKDGEIRQNYYFFSGFHRERNLSSNEGTLRWVSYAEAARLDMPVSAKHMMHHYLQVGRFDEQLYAGITEEGGTKFVPMGDFAG